MHDLLLASVLVLRLYDAFGVPAGSLHAAEGVVERTMNHSGVAVAWVVCPCGQPPRAGELLIGIQRAPRGVPGSGTLGYASVDTELKRGWLATIFADRVTTMATEAGIDVETLLGRAIAHEVGHLLLGTATHPPHGLMRARWSVDELRQNLGRDWLFSREEAAEMRGNVKARVGGQDSSAESVAHGRAGLWKTLRPDSRNDLAGRRAHPLVQEPLEPPSVEVLAHVNVPLAVGRQRMRNIQ